MSSRVLLIDIGNTRLKWGVLRDGRLGRTGSVTHESIGKTGLSALARKLPRRIDAALASNVAGPAFGTKLARFVGVHYDCDLRFARTEKEAFGVRNAYRRPRQLGVDRWAAMIGARGETRSALCIVDAGSAVTIDALDRTGQHLGGQIVPGLHLMYRSLVDNTSGINGHKIRSFEPADDTELFADGTERAVQAGALNSICGAIDRSMAIMRRTGMRPKIVITGGGAGPILSQLGSRTIHRPHLVLQGLAVMLAESP